MSSPSHFDISQLPSLQDGMSVEEEATKRRKTCRFIEEAGRLLKLPRVAVSTAEVFFHRFYAKHSFQTHDRFEVAVACLVLAAKTEEAPKKINHVMEECYKLKHRATQAGRLSSTGASSSMTNSSTTAMNSDGILDPKSDEFAKLKERILLLERVILHTIGFELSIDHPYKFLVEIIKRLVHKKLVEYEDDAKNKATSTGNTASQIQAKMLNEMVQYAMNFANDSMQTSLCLQFEPQKVATACVYLSGHFCALRPTNALSSSSSANSSGDAWIEVLGAQADTLALSSICLQILELITERKGSDHETLAKIRAELDAITTTEGDDGSVVKRQRTDD